MKSSALDGHVGLDWALSRSVVDGASSETKEKIRLPMLSQFLADQRDLTAVERFSEHHDSGREPLQAQYYRRLLPASAPLKGQQYGFEVDLDACSGCKACVAACHSLNGLDKGETWRFVGKLHGGSAESPIQKTITTACHHCLEPACMKGCPVEAYEKDPSTGIVRHLDDQCIGCQYCVLTCPYDVPQFHVELGIVRKCDMCADRLAEEEAPACVQACPNGAISIAIVDEENVAFEGETSSLVPGAPPSNITLPTTRYVSSRNDLEGLEAVDVHAVRPAPHHHPLMWMLVLTQLSVGAFAVDAILANLHAGWHDVGRAAHGLWALFAGLLALGASTAHLGRPRFAFRAILGLRTSWLSREVLSFGFFAGSACLYAFTMLFPAADIPLLSPVARRFAFHRDALGWGVAGLGLFAVFTSVMLYHVTRRELWSFSRTAFRFFGTVAILGLATAQLTLFASAAIASEASPELFDLGRGVAHALTVAAGAKLLFELSLLRHRGRGPADALGRSAMLLLGPLGGKTLLRFMSGALGGVILPLITTADAENVGAPVALAGALASMALLTGGELLERSTFFTAMSGRRMPGGLR